VSELAFPRTPALRLQAASGTLATADRVRGDAAQGYVLARTRGDLDDGREAFAI